MGRTNPTFRDLLARVETDWGDYRRVLRRRDQPRFDRLFEYARAHADAATNQNHAEPLIPVLVAVALEQERRLDEQAERLDEQVDRIDALDARLDASTAAADDDAV